MILNMSVLDFANHFIPSNENVRLIKDTVIIFDDLLENLYYDTSGVLRMIVTMVSASDGTLCLSVREPN